MAFHPVSLSANKLHFLLLYSAPAVSGALQGAVNAVAEFAKQKEHRTNADMMGTEIAKHAGIKDIYGKAFATGFLETAHLK